MQTETERLGINDSFNFSCGHHLECFNLCCRDINLFLTPYDIVRIKRRLEMTSGEFLKVYTIPLFPEEVGHPVILMKMLPETMYCPFVSEKGCMIYDDRPWSCRSFPLEPLEDSAQGAFGIVRRDFCCGFGSRKLHSVKKWRETQNISFYEDINAEWKKITHHEDFQSHNFLEGSARDIFFLGSYNIDEFRKMVFQGDFLQYIEVDKKTLKQIKASETELLRLAFRWLRHVLFHEDTLKRRRGHPSGQ